MAEEKLSADEERLNRIVLDIITTSNAIGLYKGLGKILFKPGNERLLRNIRHCLNLDDVTINEFKDAMREYDTLPSGHSIRQKAPYDLVHSSYSDVVAYYNNIKFSKHSKAA